jgi:steroid 5-alpha reductase family enzyme
MSIPVLLPITLAAAIVIMILAWAVHLRLGKASVVDAFWGPGFAVIAWLSFGLVQGPPARQTLLALLVTVWAVRLAFHVSRRNRGKPEDPRYAAMRAKHPETFWIRSLPLVFLLQAVIMWLVSLPVQIGMRGAVTESFGLLEWAGLLLWGFGFFWEAVGDEQLYRFKSKPENKGRILDRGLWRYTRHPNYFGETVMWWSLWIIACAAPGGWLSFIGPLLLTLLLLKVSGVSLTEQTMRRSHTDLDEYKRRVSPFLPRPPKEPSS